MIITVCSTITISTPISLLKFPTSALSNFTQNKIQHKRDKQKQFWIAFVTVSAYTAPLFLLTDTKIFFASFPLQYDIQQNFSNNDSWMLSNVRHIRISKTLKHGNNCIWELRKYGISSIENRIHGYAACNLYFWLTLPVPHLYKQQLTLEQMREAKPPRTMHVVSDYP